MSTYRTEDGVSLYYDVHDFRDPWIEDDEPETVLLHHGFARSMKWWQPWVPALSRTYRVVRFDVRGCGRSEVPPRDADWSATRLIDDALGLINHLKIQRVHWIGEASGALLGEIFAVTYPERLQSLTLISGPPVLEQSLLASYALTESDSLVAMERYGLPEWLRRTNAARFDEGGDPRFVAWHTAEQSKTAFHAAYRLHETFRNGDMRGELSKIKAPTLLVVPSKSPVTPLEQQKMMQAKIPNARLVVVEGKPSELVLTVADRTIAQTLRFLADIGGAPPPVPS